jgi:hypothetical protein
MDCEVDVSLTTPQTELRCPVTNSPNTGFEYATKLRSLMLRQIAIAEGAQKDRRPVIATDGAEEQVTGRIASANSPGALRGMTVDGT